MHIQSLEVRVGKVVLELLPKVEEGVETVGDQDVLQEEQTKRKDVNRRLFSSCCFITFCHTRVCSGKQEHS